MRRHSLGLQPGAWLHNSVIDNYIEFLKYTQGYGDEKRSNGKTMIYSFADSKKFEYPQSFNFNSGGKYFTNYKKIGMVINEKDEHWFFIGVIPSQNKMIVYDSIPRKRDTYLPWYNNYKEFMQLERKASNNYDPVIMSLHRLSLPSLSMILVRSRRMDQIVEFTSSTTSPCS